MPPLTSAAKILAQLSQATDTDNLNNFAGNDSSYEQVTEDANDARRRSRSNGGRGRSKLIESTTGTPAPIPAARVADDSGGWLDKAIAGWWVADLLLVLGLVPVAFVMVARKSTDVYLKRRVMLAAALSIASYLTVWHYGTDLIRSWLVGAGAYLISAGAAALACHSAYRVCSPASSGNVRTPVGAEVHGNDDDEDEDEDDNEEGEGENEGAAAV